MAVREPAPQDTPLVVALDIGSSSVRALAFDARGTPVATRQLDCEMDTTRDGGVEIDADRLVTLSGVALDGLLSELGAGRERVRAVATTTFWHTLVAVGADGRARTPVYSWADTRSAGEVARLADKLDPVAYHARTGCLLHTSYLPARLSWLRKRHPDAFRATRWFMALGDYLLLRLCGETRTSLSMASGSGLLDLHTRQWDGPTLEVLGLEPARLPPLCDRDAPLAGLSPEHAARWPALARLPWYPALGDGACSNVGAGCLTAARAALMVGTSGAMRVSSETESIPVPPGLWCYRVDRRRVLLGGALSNGGSVYAWLVATLRSGGAEALEAELCSMPPDAHGLTVLPFLAGERSPGWVATARAAVVGLSLATRPADLVRAGLETVAYRFALVHEQLRAACPDLSEIVATGGALLGSPVWTGIMADVLGVPIVPCLEPEGSSRGAALLALETLGVLPSLHAAPPRMGEAIQPDPERHARYRMGLARHRRLYDHLIPFYRDQEEA